MLTKPISLYPDAVSISPTDNKITLSATYPASCSFETFVGEDGVEYCYASLFISDGDSSYQILGKNFYPVVVRHTDSIEVEYLIDLSRTDLTAYPLNCYTTEAKEHVATSTGNVSYRYTLRAKAKTLNIIKKNKIYRWKIRVFEKQSILNESSYYSNISIGYGSISQFVRSQDTNQVMLTIFPHTNIYTQVEPGADPGGSLTKSDITGGVKIQSAKSISEVNKTILMVKTIADCILKQDKNIRYYILTDGNQYPILNYKFVPMTETTETDGFVYDIYDSNVKNLWNGTKGCADRLLYTTSGHLDSYGNPAAGYAIIDSEDEFQDGSTYKLCCNYIDSDEAYFEVHSEPVITLTETNAQIELTDVDGNVLYTKTNPYSLSYCNINISGEFYQAEGVEYSYYSYKIYEKNSMGDYERIYHSDNIYNSDLRIEYDDLLEGHEYKIVLNIVDTKNTTFEREFYLTTTFASTLNPMMARAEYYKDHNSVIVEWSALNSITPIVKNSNYEFVDLSGNGVTDAVYVDEGNTVTYYQNDFNQPLSFSNPTFGIRFKATEKTTKIAEVHSPDNIYTISIDSLYNVDEKDCKDVIIINTATKRYVYSIKNRVTTEEAIEALSTGVSPADKTLVWDNNLVWDNSYTWVNGQDTIESEYMVIVNPYGQCVVKNLTLGTEMVLLEETSFKTNVINESKVILYGNTYFSEMTVINNGDEGLLKNIKDATVWTWLDNTQLLSSFNTNFNGAEGSTVGNSKLIGYRVYKSIGDSSKLYKIAETNVNETIIEDFIVGDNCPYKYYIYPTFQDQLNENLYYPNAAVETNEITLNHATNKVVSLKKIGDEIYCVDLDSVWRLILNLEDSGYTIKNSKTFADSLSAYTQEYVGSMKYITKSVSGLIGMIDCYSGGDIVDTYDMLLSWNDFATNADLKCYVDSRGLILPGNFEAEPSVEYVKHPKSYAVAKFNWRQKSDLDIIKIYATIIPYNPIHEGALYSDDSLGLMSVDNKLLLANGR